MTNHRPSSTPFLPTAILLLSSTLLTAQESKEYTRYKTYHPYCSTREQMKQRSIPPLSQTDDDTLSPQLIHVTALIRHGARTPNASPNKYICWDDYWTNPSTGIWNCDLKTYMAPPSAQFKSNHGDNLMEEEADFLFEKHYDALVLEGGNRTGNELNGDCQSGQLLMRGYEQELKNGYVFVSDMVFIK
jgi:hypothetical protein